MSSGSYWSSRASDYSSSGRHLEASHARSYAEHLDRQASERSRSDDERSRRLEESSDSAQDGLSCVSRCIGSSCEALITKRQSLGEVVVTTDAMFAKTVLELSDSSELCPLLQEMDRAESQIQAEEQRKIQEKRIEVKAGLNTTAATIASAYFGSILFAITPPPFSAMLTAAVGGVAAVISDNTDAFGNATQYAEKNLDIYGKRVARLREMEDKISRER